MPELRTNTPDLDMGRGLVIQAGEILYDFATGDYTLTVPAGTLVLFCFAVVTEAFNGTSPLIKVGDGDDDDGYFTSAQIAPATAGSVSLPAIRRSDVGAANIGGSTGAFLGGKYYSAADTIDIDWTAASASPTTGRLVVGYVGIRIDRFGLAKSLTAALAGTF